MRNRWFLARPVVGAVAIAFTLTTAIPPGSFAQPEPEPESTPAGGESCDLTGQWRSTRGPMTLVHAPVRAPTDPLLGDAALAETARRDETTGVLSGSIRTADGEGELDATVAGGRVELSWHVPTVQDPAVSGDGYFEIAEDCDSLSGAYRTGTDGPFSEPWSARRIAFAPEAGTDAAALQANLSRVDEGIAAIGALRDTLPRTDIDVAARADSLPASIDAIHAHVRDEIAFEAYQGVLRGARGALVSGAGNAADQSLLLAALLRHHGFHVRFAAGTLEQAAAARLVDGMQADGTDGRLAALDQDAQTRLIAASGIEPGRIAAQSAPRQAARAALLATLDADVARFDPAIAALLADNGLALDIDPARLRDMLIARTRPHLWVQVETAGGWRDLDPLADDGAALADAAETHETLPEAMHHVVRFRLTIERLADGALSQQDVGGWEIKLADLAERGFPGIWISNQPLDSPETVSGQAAFEDIADFAADMAPRRMLAAEKFQPVLSMSTGEIQTGTGFDLEGNVVPSDWRVSAAAELGGAIGGAMSAGGGMLEGLLGGLDGAPATPPAKPALTAQWIEFEIAGPGLQPRSERRFLLDRIGPAARADGISALSDTAPDDDATRMALATMNEILVTTGTVSEAFAFDVMLAGFAENGPMLERLARLTSGAVPLDRELFESMRLYPNKMLIHLLLQQEQARLAARAAGVHAYSDSGMVSVRRMEIWQDADGSYSGGQSIDLVHTGLRVAAIAGTTAERIGAFHGRYGVALTGLEREMLNWIRRAECPDCESRPGTGTMAVMDAAAAADVPLRVLTPDNREAVPAALSADDRQRIAAELAAGYWVVVPDGTVEIAGAPARGWWRIDPATGAVLGMTPGGGSNFTEYLAFIVVVGWPALLGFPMGFFGCTGLGGDPSGGKVFGCFLCGLVTAICLELAWLATNVIGVVAASSTCGLGSAVAGTLVCGISGMAH